MFKPYSPSPKIYAHNPSAQNPAPSNHRNLNLRFQPLQPARLPPSKNKKKQIQSECFEDLNPILFVLGPKKPINPNKSSKFIPRAKSHPCSLGTWTLRKQRTQPRFLWSPSSWLRSASPPKSYFKRSMDLGFRASGFRQSNGFQCTCRKKGRCCT